jgi:hypothetical protein
MVIPAREKRTKTTLTIALDPSLKEWVESQAKESKVSQSRVIEYFLEEARAKI